jgi:hypothetical protein
MESPQINVAVEELTFNLFQRPLHPELFTIYAKRKLLTEKYEADIWVTGCTHVAAIYAGDVCLTEVIKCTLSRGVSYMTDFQIEKMSANLYRQSYIELEKFAKKRGIFVKFPASEIDGLVPFCYIDFEARRTELHLHTFSAHPDQITMIKTQSLFNFS